MVGYEPDLNPPKSEESDDEEFSLMPSPRNGIPSSVITPSRRPDIEFQDDDDDSEEKEKDDGYAGVLATPLVQVFSVSVSTGFGDGKPCEIHGSIRVFEGSDCLYDLYHRLPEDSETILDSGTLSLMGPHDGAILPSMRTTLVIQLKDRIHGVDVVNTKLKLDLSTEDSYDRLKKRVIEGDYGSVVVYYVVFRFAFYGYVHVTVAKSDKDDEKCNNNADIYGSVVAKYENARMYCSGEEDDVQKLETRLFDHPSCRPLRVPAGTDFRILTVVAVPVYSTLAIDVNLWDLNGEIASDRLQFTAYLQSEVPLYIQTEYARVEVQINWQIPHLDPNMVQRTAKVLHDQHLLANLVPAPFPIKRHCCGNLKTEVFTVFIGGINEKVSALCGTILVEDGSLEIFSIYNRDKSSAELLRDHSLACIEVNYRAIQHCEFYIMLHLTDPDGKLEVSRGDLCFHLGFIVPKMFERRLCSIVRGKDGFAAVHYEAFNNAYEAFVNVKLFATNGDVGVRTSLYGTLLASYSGHTYSTSYEKLYYKSRLFDRPEDNAVESETGSKIALLKSIVVVPGMSTLIIEADLLFQAFGINNVVEVIDGKAEFEINTRDIAISKRIQGQDYGIEIEVKFKG